MEAVNKSISLRSDMWEVVDRFADQCGVNRSAMVARMIEEAVLSRVRLAEPRPASDVLEQLACLLIDREVATAVEGACVEAGVPVPVEVRERISATGVFDLAWVLREWDKPCLASGGAAVEVVGMASAASAAARVVASRRRPYKRDGENSVER